MSDYKKVHESEYGSGPMNFHVSKRGDAVSVELTYPPWSDAENKGQCRYIMVDQESVRASDGLRLYYDYDRDGFVVQQPKSRLEKLSEGHYTTVEDWTEVGFFQSWKFEEDGEGEWPRQSDYDEADARFNPTA